jgi:O-succinylbenzoate synthase
MTRSKRAPMTVIGLGVAAAVSVVQATIQATGEERTSALTFKPLAGINLSIGSKQIAGYFVADANVCNLTLVVGESMVDDQVPTSTSARIQQTLAPNETGRLDTVEGQSLEFGCKPGARALSVSVLKQAAAYRPAK